MFEGALIAVLGCRMLMEKYSATIETNSLCRLSLLVGISPGHGVGVQDAAFHQHLTPDTIGCNRGQVVVENARGVQDRARLSAVWGFGHNPSIITLLMLFVKFLLSPYPWPCCSPLRGCGWLWDAFCGEFGGADPLVV